MCWIKDSSGSQEGSCKTNGLCTLLGMKLLAWNKGNEVLEQTWGLIFRGKNCSLS